MPPAIGLGPLLAIFIAAAAATWVAGVYLSTATDVLDDRFGLGDAGGGLLLLRHERHLRRERGPAHLRPAGRYPGGRTRAAPGERRVAVARRARRARDRHHDLRLTHAAAAEDPRCRPRLAPRATHLHRGVLLLTKVPG